MQEAPVDLPNVECAARSSEGTFSYEKYMACSVAKCAREVAVYNLRRSFQRSLCFNLLLDPLILAPCPVASRYHTLTRCFGGGYQLPSRPCSCTRV